MDDKANESIPNKHRKQTAPEPTWSVALNGITDYVTERITLTSPYCSSPIHDTDISIQELFLTIVTNMNGHRFIAGVFDQGPIGYNVHRSAGGVEKECTENI